jgi:hypothetical protein
MKLMQELFGGVERSKALAYLFEHAERDFGSRELAQAAGVDAGNTSRWLRRWAEAGILERSTSTGRARYRVSQDAGLNPLIAFFQQFGSPARLLRQRVQDLGDEVQAAAIFGSTAAGAAGSASDIDVLLLTDMPRVRAQALFKAPARELGRAVNVLAYSPEAWRAAVQEGNPLALDILHGPLTRLKGDLHDTAQT